MGEGDETVDVARVTFLTGFYVHVWAFVCLRACSAIIDNILPFLQPGSV